ncbi:MAG: TetR/AcrR family transcriptional regulator [Proteobacteria bacterium]|nr:TetR/AcrR family transcriptional regulator [Desulfobacula sp.]MBU3951941.1 TetR/AcrR family transcriptional regulator [Pseudomonadota bacterium]MBU4130082.1 TetR/AcrR family transcriptional regulator [Pseudomonadota bacterium]
MALTRIPDKNRERILESARAIVLDKGIDALSVRILAKEANLALRTIYNLFGSKEAVVIELFRQGTKDLDTATLNLRQAMAEKPWDTAFYLTWIKTVESMFINNQDLIKSAVLTGFSQKYPISENAALIHENRIKEIEAALNLAAQKNLIWNDLDLKVVSRLLYQNYFNVVVQWARGDFDDRGLIVFGRYAVLTILHTLINEDNRRENTLNLLRELKEEK